MKNHIPDGDFYHYLPWERRKPYYTNYYLDPDERRELIKDCGASGLILFEYFLFMANQKGGNQEIADERIADWFGWTIHTAKRHRLRLIAEDWLHIERHKGKDQNVFTYFLGKDIVREYKAKNHAA